MNFVVACGRSPLRVRNGADASVEMQSASGTFSIGVDLGADCASDAMTSNLVSTECLLRREDTTSAAIA